MAAESFLISAQGLSTQAAGLPFFLLTDVRICSDAQVAGELGILDRNQRAKGEPFADGGWLFLSTTRLKQFWYDAVSPDVACLAWAARKP